MPLEPGGVRSQQSWVYGWQWSTQCGFWEPNLGFVIVGCLLLTTDPSLQSQTNRFGLYCFPSIPSSPFLQLTFFCLVLIQCTVLSLTYKHNTSLVLHFLLETKSLELSNAYSYPDNICMLYFLFIFNSKQALVTHLSTLFYVIWVLLLFNFYSLRMCQALKILLIANLMSLVYGVRMHFFLFPLVEVCSILQQLSALVIRVCVCERNVRSFSDRSLSECHLGIWLIILFVFSIPCVLVPYLLLC